MVLLFDDAKELEKEIGEQATKVIARVLEKQEEQYKQELATKADLMMVKSDLQKDIQDVRTEIQGVRTEIQKSQVNMIKWFAGLMVVQAGTIAALVKLLG